MFDTDTLPTVPSYELKVGGVVKTYDAIVLGYALKGIDTVVEPGEICAAVNKAFDITVDTLTAAAILKDFFQFSRENLEGPLKKVLGQELFSATTTDSAPATS